MAEKKLTTMEQLRALAEKGKLDTLTRIDALLEVITPLLESAQHTGITGRELERQSSDCAGRVPLSRQQVLVHCMC